MTTIVTENAEYRDADVIEQGAYIRAEVSVLDLPVRSVPGESGERLREREFMTIIEAHAPELVDLFESYVGSDYLDLESRDSIESSLAQVSDDVATYLRERFESDESEKAQQADSFGDYTRKHGIDAEKRGDLVDMIRHQTVEVEIPRERIEVIVHE